MTFPILGGNGAGDAGYQIDNSLRFNRGDEPRLTRTPSSSNRKTFTLSSWVKRSAVNVSYEQVLYEVRPLAGTYFSVSFRNTGSPADDELFISSSAGSFNISLEGVFRDVSAWYHIVLAFDTTQTTSSDRIKMYVNGNQVSTGYYTTYPAQNTDLIWNTNNEHRVGGSGFSASTESSNFYLAEIHHIDGQALSPTDFGEFDESGIWKPLSYTGSYGTNGFYLDFENSGSLGADQSSNSNNFTPTNLASNDQTQDTPTNNFCTWNPLYKMGTPDVKNGNLVVVHTATDLIGGTQYVSSGKWYYEARLDSSNAAFIGWLRPDVTTFTGNSFQQAGSLTYFSNNGGRYKDGDGGASYGASYTTGDIIGCALNLDDNQVTWYKNNSSQGTISITAGNYIPMSASGSATPKFTCNFGQDSSFHAQETAGNNTDDNGFGDFHYAPPSGYLALCTQNLATELEPTIDDSSAYFHTQLYTGTGSTNAVTNDANAGDFKPDWLWLKNRSATSNHYIMDSNRGDFVLYSNLSNSEDSAGYFESFDSDGFTVSGNTANANASGNNFTAWQWKANGGTTSSNTDGSITSTVQANTTAGFSIVTFTGTGANGTFGHGLGAVPKMIIFKNRTDASHWICYHEALGNTTGVYLNLTNANAGTSSAFFNNTTPTSSVVSVGVMNEGNGSGDNIVAYCFSEKIGYSKFGSYTGGGSNFPFVYTGFRPAWVMIKRTNSTSHWTLYDSVRNPYNRVDDLLYANLSNNESQNDNGRPVDFLSNGFKLRGSSSEVNASGSTYIYMAFGHTFVSSNSVPNTAR